MGAEKSIGNGEEDLDTGNRSKVKLVIHGEEMIEKTVRLSGNSGRIYLPAHWEGCRVKIVKVD